MDFTKPLVTIGLDEYNFLLEKKKELEAGDKPTDEQISEAIGYMVDAAKRGRGFDTLKDSFQAIGVQVVIKPKNENIHESIVVIRKINKDEGSDNRI